MADLSMDKSELLREAVRTFVRMQAGKRLAALGGMMPEIRDVPRRREEEEEDARRSVVDTG